MRPKSLTFRLALIGATGSAFALLIAAVVFVSLFRQSAERAFDDRLSSLLSALVGAAISETGVDTASADMIAEPRFSLPQSGWYWQIRDTRTGEVVAASFSLFGDSLPELDLPSRADDQRVLEITGPDDKRLRALERLITVGEGPSYAVLVAGDADALAQEVARFGTIVGLTLGALAILLALAVALLIRFGLRPLRDVRWALRRVRQGEAAQLEGEFPAEIAPLVADLNALLTSNREIVERARTHVGNLAHALKTPLAVLQNESRDVAHPLARKVAEQVALMRDQVGHHLDRARIAAQSNVIGAVTPVGPVLDGLTRVMRKIYQDRALEISVESKPDLRFRGERHDLEEMIGNLFDNACKWARGRVRIVVSGRADRRRPLLVVIVEDDGPGLPDAQKAAALARGGRLDESKPGSGLGLSIVIELASIYGGSLSLTEGGLGGLSASLVLPSATKEDL
ncbi:ATP-binding protein [Propylenella binzhouense]|uniref:histidine kinase n=1 Tax=Propylenella binzhouense TaxID=2555902 RepID=A0A964T8A6_9HYPH|nr:ATP-binding protein [Propylenella binzhouense]MYZ50396.1 HAMP domain-containing protein [Propylenella binzhouense]